ncbi:hypothetical protein GCG54_00005871 [Colletotrichum gloeosporioides]|uniref:Heterokaryon incompatibility domain-containing protein n=1 Tax=Colletotrichum gloeosporioides TaxID=474922 RepID=A0A8H4CJI1_COLGL|nr:uncharacterized protein GCG54_00005871 [Colletotrichum gloeosporioides]KAF3805125.1 hypothetical protein GCG54_00005871 [Colletotrichum gloeosporioides]
METPEQDVVESFLNTSPTGHHHACGHCTSLLISPSGEDRKRRATVWRNDFHRDMEAVHEAADAGCPFFAWLREHIARSSSPIERLLQVKMKFILNSSRENLADVYRCDLVVRMTDGQRHYLLPMPSLDVESDEGETATEPAVFRTIDGISDVESGIGQIRRRLAWCLECHKDECRQETEVRPLRFISVGTGDMNSVHITKLSSTGTDPYVALSYCWGSEQFVKTTSLNLSHHEDMIKITSLPKTIQDAIFVTRKLGIGLLWVDSLCIVQDDTESLAKEVQHMADYYANSVLTISAARAKSCHDGFLSRNDEQGTNVLTQFYFPAHFGEKRDVAKYLKLVPPTQQEDLPIDARGWTFQESIMATRLATFGERRIWWSCMARGANQTRSVGHNVLRTEIFDYRRDMHVGSPHWRQEYELRRLTLWARLLNDYTSRVLFVPQDRLPAIAGIARMAASFFNNPEKPALPLYVAGLWNTKELPLQLLWVPRKERALHSSYIAPSWSWASYTGQVSWNWPNYATFPAQSYLGTDQELTDPRDPDIQEVSVSLCNDIAPYGAITAGFLRLNCISFDPSQLTRGPRRHLELLFDADGNESTSLDAVDWPYWDEYGGLLCIHVSNYEGDYPRGLILAPNEDSTYRRVGVFFNWRSDQPSRELEHRKQEITII